MVLELNSAREQCSALALFFSGDVSEVAEGQGGSDQCREPCPLRPLAEEPDVHAVRAVGRFGRLRENREFSSGDQELSRSGCSRVSLTT